MANLESEKRVEELLAFANKIFSRGKVVDTNDTYVAPTIEKTSAIFSEKSDGNGCENCQSCKDCASCDNWKDDDYDDSSDESGSKYSP